MHPRPTGGPRATVERVRLWAGLWVGRRGWLYMHPRPTGGLPPAMGMVGVAGGIRVTFRVAGLFGRRSTGLGSPHHPSTTYGQRT